MHSDSFSYALFDKAVLYKSFRDTLVVYIVDDLDLYCMKLVSFRPKDIHDMDVLSTSLKDTDISASDILANFNRLYGDEYLLRNDERKALFIKMQFNTK